MPALDALNRALAELAVPSMIVGGIAVIAHGVPRLTTDIDALVWGEDVRLPKLFSVLEQHGILPRSSD